MKMIAVFFGGRSAEHEVSIASAAYLIPLLQKRGLSVSPIYVTKSGALCAIPPDVPIGEGTVPATNRIPLSLRYENARLSLCAQNAPPFYPDGAISLLHGTYGEDGAWQGLFTLASLPFVGAEIRPSAIAMHKPTAKKLAQALGIPTLPHKTLAHGESHAITDIEKTIPYPVFVKPASGGSSLGASKAADRAELSAALTLAFSYGDAVIAEPYIKAAELSVAVWEEQGLLRVSSVGETVANGAFYDYTAKYASDETRFICPADLTVKTAKELQRQAKEIFLALHCRHLARVDFLRDTASGIVYFNEINTLPGFTAHSLFPRLLREAGADPVAVLTEVFR